MKIPFTGLQALMTCLDHHPNFNSLGSGIRLYAVVVWAFSFTASIDGGSPKFYQFDGVLGCCDNETGPAYNFNFYNVQSLPYGGHTLVITLVDTTSAHTAFGGRNSTLCFDYAAVNDSNPATR